MYEIPTNLRDRTIKLRLNDEELEVLRGVTAGGQKAVVARELVIENILNKFDPEGVKGLTGIDQNQRIEKVTKLIEKLITENDL